MLMHTTPAAATGSTHAPAQRHYRAYYTPLDRDRFPVPCDTGVLPYVQVLATDAEHAQRAAHAVTGCPIANVERLEAVAPLLDSAAARADRRRFTGDPITGFGALA
jgi:hypothetical protein